MDKLYVGDIPQNFHYAVFSDNHIDLYDSPVLHNNTYNYYRIYKNLKGFYYTENQQVVGNYTTTYTTDISITDNVCYRDDFSSICSTTFLIAFFGIFLLNIITSIVRKGGILGGLL